MYAEALWSEGGVGHAEVVWAALGAFWKGQQEVFQEPSPGLESNVVQETGPREYQGPSFLQLSHCSPLSLPPQIPLRVDTPPKTTPSSNADGP